jgi:hypothetical protein
MRNVRLSRIFLDKGLNRQAVVAIEKWHFAPGIKDGKLVRVPLEVTLGQLQRHARLRPPQPIARRNEVDGAIENVHSAAAVYTVSR